MPRTAPELERCTKCRNLTLVVRRGVCRPCAASYQQTYYHKNLERCRANKVKWQREYRKRHPEYDQRHTELQRAKRSLAKSKLAVA